ncbi:DsbA family protein [Hoeflea prorocentri]|uniref:DsbA family protein n=1 Tax=Hoeflea prorocentri TaxID=1922333 RepID=A0A9X3ZH42_9HYPH|nr:DsbA family protein [Hoeflea prorocentri]MCY6380894.1 DsbA family protein [Hoeflea prorocentri]MDA5398694.1 DsbA family protein [Hoeflea prorocentri]
MKTIYRRIAGVLVATFIAVSPLPAVALDDAQKEELGEFIREYLISNPEIMFEVQAAYEAKQEQIQKQQAQQVIADSGDAIFNSPHNIVLGNPEGNVTIVEFFDYNCGFCKRAMKDMEEILASDPNVRFILKEFPILGDDSIAAHRVSTALKNIAPDVYQDFHFELLGGNERATEDRAISVAVALGVEEAALREAMKDESITDAFRESYTIADAIGISGTPSYIVGDEAVFGAVGTPTLMNKIANLRDCQSTTC